MKFKIINNTKSRQTSDTIHKRSIVLAVFLLNTVLLHADYLTLTSRDIYKDAFKPPEDLISVKRKLIKPIVIGAHILQIKKRKLTNLDYQKLVYIRECYKNGDPVYVKVINKLKGSANQVLEEGPFSVMQKTTVPPSGNKHDYLSMGPYWWPDSDKAHGLPWIHRDGEVNPLTRGDNVDQPAKEKFEENLRKLSWAYFFTGNKEYAVKAKELLKVWFSNPATKMNPNLNYVAGIPGRSKGRGSGIVQFADMPNIITAIELLRMDNFLSKKTRDGLNRWFNNYLHWLQMSKLGLSGKGHSNNIGTWYDVQVVAILLFLNREKEAKTVLNRVKKSRIDAHITKDGKQPRELERTKTLSYSAKNLRGLTQLAYYGTKLGVDLWNYEPKNGDGIQQAFEFLYPYAKGDKTWKRQQISHLEPTLKRLQRLFGMAGRMFDVERYREVAPPMSQKRFEARLAVTLQ